MIPITTNNSTSVNANLFVLTVFSAKDGTYEMTLYAEQDNNWLTTMDQYNSALKSCNLAHKSRFALPCAISRTFSPIQAATRYDCLIAWAPHLKTKYVEWHWLFQTAQHTCISFYAASWTMPANAQTGS